MKKLNILLTAFVAMAMTACTVDDGPVLKTPTQTNFLNPPVMQQAEITLSKENPSVLHLTCSQPDYGFAAAATYVPQVSYGTAFSKEVSDEYNLTIDPAEYVELATGFNNCAEINIPSDELSAALCLLQHVKYEDELDTTPMRVYVRLVAKLANMNTYSNVVYFDKVATYYNMWVAGEAVDIYLRGDFNGWGADPASQFHTGEARDTWETDVLTITAGGFKVADSNWASFNCGGSGAIKPNIPFVLDKGSNPANITIENDFTGTALLQYKNGSYLLTLIPEPEQL